MDASTRRRRATSSAVLAIFGALVLAGCATMSAKSAFTRGEKARARGAWDEAIEAYDKAADADPKKPEYRTAAEGARREAAGTRVSAARAAEARGDHAAAAKLYEEALRWLPGDPELTARRDLAILRTQEADPVEYYEAARKLAAALPNDGPAQEALVGAKKAAVAYHLRLADTYVEAKAHERAHAEFEIARKIDPENAAFRSEGYRRTEARFLEAAGDERAKAGDNLGAFEAYQRAAALESTPTLNAKLKRAERGAGPLVEQLEQARQLEGLRQWEDAAEIYTAIQSRPGVPADIGPRAAKARAESAKVRAERARTYADKGMLAKAAAELTSSLEHTDGPKEPLALLAEAIEAITANRPGEAKLEIDRAKELAPDVPAISVAPAVLQIAALNAYADAKRLAESDPAGGLIALRRLDPFADKLRGFTEAKEKLVKRAFGALVEGASARAAEGRYEEAAELLQTALEISKAPGDLADHLRAGAVALSKKDWELAIGAFDRALAVNGRSNLARVGRGVAAAARLAELRRDAQDARAAEDSLRAASAYRAILAIDPEDAEAKAGAAELRAQLVDGALASAKTQEAAGKSGVAYVYYRRVLDLDPDHAEAKAAAAALSQALGAGGGEPEGWVAPAIRGDHLGDACPGAEEDLRDRLALHLNKTRKLGAEFVAHDVEQAIEAKKRPEPAAVLRTALEACDLQANGSMTITLQLVLSGASIAEERVVARLDTSGIPKDELADGLTPERTQKLLLGEAAKAITNAIKPHAGKLGGWRVLAASSAIKANDAEAAASAYAALASSRELTDEERGLLRDLERFLINKYR